MAITRGASKGVGVVVPCHRRRRRTSRALKITKATALLYCSSPCSRPTSPLTRCALRGIFFERQKKIFAEKADRGFTISGPTAGKMPEVQSQVADPVK